MNVSQILAITTATGNSDSFEVVNADRPVTIRCKGTLTAAEDVADIQYKDGAGTWQDYAYNGSKVTLSDTQNAVMMVSPGEYRGQKSATTATVGLEVVRHGAQYAAAS